MNRFSDLKKGKEFRSLFFNRFAYRTKEKAMEYEKLNKEAHEVLTNEQDQNWSAEVRAKRGIGLAILALAAAIKESSREKASFTGDIGR